MRLRPPCWLAGLAACCLNAAPVLAQGSFVYTNNNVNGSNSVTGFSVDSTGALTEVPGSPFLTGGDGSGGGFFASDRITIAGNFLFASNAGTFDVSVFSIDAGSGGLTLVPGSPFPTGGYGGNGIGLAATPAASPNFGSCLYAGDSLSGTITSFGVGPDGALTQLQRSFAGGFINGIKTSPDGRFVAAVLSGYGPHSALAMFTIDATTCGLTPVSGTPFLVRPAGPPAGTGQGVDINCAGNLMFVSEAANPTSVNVYNVDANGVPSAIPGSPFEPGVGFNSNVPRLSPNGTLLFVSNQGMGSPGPSNTVTVLSVADGGALTLVPGSPFEVGGDMFFPAGMATDQAGAFLFVAGIPNFVRVFSVDPGGALTQVGAPVATGQPSGLLSLIAFPPKQCSLDGSQ